MYYFISSRNNSDDNRKKGGFTLIELMAIIIVLSLIIIIVVGIVNGIVDNSKDIMDETTKNMIISAAEGYALEYRGEDTWNQEIDNLGNISFCVSLNSLINYGYFTNSGNNFDDYRNKYAVKFDIVNGVTTSSFIDLDEVDNGVCRYYIEESNIASNESNKVDVKDDKGIKIGDFNYDIDKVDNNRYDLGIDLNIINSLVSTTTEHAPVNVLYIVDRSSSMEYVYVNNGEIYYPEKYENVKKAVISSSQYLIRKNNKSKVGLILFDAFSYLSRNFESKIIVNSDFAAVGSGTNIAEGIDTAVGLLYKSLSKEELENTYVILLSDGGNSVYSYTVDNINSTELYKKSNRKPDLRNYDINSNKWAKKYFNSVIDPYENYNNKYAIEVEYCENIYDENVCQEYNYKNIVYPELVHSTNYLKNLGAKFFMIGYDFLHEDSLKMLATQNNDLCVNGDGFTAYSNKGNNYCYYDCYSIDMVKKILENLLQNIVEYNSNFDKVNLVIESKVNSSGESLVTFVKDEEPVDGNKIIETINSSSSNVNQQIKLDETYSFKLNSVVYDLCSSNGDTKQCNLDSVQLFDTYIEVIYSDGSVTKISVDVPLFEVSVLLVDKLN